MRVIDLAAPVIGLAARVIDQVKPVIVPKRVRRAVTSQAATSQALVSSRLEGERIRVGDARLRLGCAAADDLLKCKRVLTCAPPSCQFFPLVARPIASRAREA